MSNKQSTISYDPKVLYMKALISQHTNDDQQALSHYGQALNQIKSIGGTNQKSQDIIQLQYEISFNMCNIYIGQHNLTMACLLIDKALQMAYNLQQQDKIAQCLDKRGEIKRLKGDYDNALLDHNKSVEVKLKIHEKEGLDIAKSYFNIANVYLEQGKYDDAVDMYKKSLKIKLSALGDNHPSIAETYNNMGNVYLKQGKYDDTVDMYEKSLKITLPALGDNHPSIASTYGNMGTVYLEQGKYDDAVDMYEKSLKIELSALGDNHPSIASTYNNIGLVYSNQGKYDDALDMYKKSLKIQLSAIGNNHPSIATTYGNMGTVYREQGKYDDAVDMYEKSLKIELSALDDNHPSIANTYNNMGLVYEEQGKYDDALSMYEKSLKIELSALGDNHPSIVTTYNNMGNVYREQGKYDDAISLYEKAATILVDAHLQNHPNLSKIYNNIAICFDKQNRHDDATAMRQRSKDIRHYLQQADTINQTYTNVSNQSQGSQDEIAAQDDTPEHLSNQQSLSQQTSNPSDNQRDNHDHSHTQQNDDHVIDVLKEKQYFTAFTQALKKGSCKNKIIRAMFSGPQCVGKSSIMTVFTQQQLVKLHDPTQIADQSDKMVYVKVYKIKDRTAYDLNQIYNNNVYQGVEQVYETQINNQQTLTVSPLTRELQDQHLLINDQHLTAGMHSITPNHQTTATTLTSSSTPTTISSTDNNEFVQKRRDFFQHYYPSWLNKTADDSQYAKIWDFGGQPIYHVTHQPFLSGNSIYILVFNIEQNIHDRVVTRDGHTLDITYLQSMQEWLTSIIGGNENQEKMIATIDNDEAEYSLPIVILVASYGDRIASQQQGKNRFIEFERELRNTMPRYKSNIYSSGIIFNCNPQDNSDITVAKREKCSLRLHEIMKSFVESLPFMRAPIPIRWYMIATILHTPTDSSSNDEEVSSFINQIRATQVHKIMTIQQIKSLAIDCGLYEGDEELIAMLSYLHDLGEVIFCRQADEHGLIVTDVDWLLRIFRAIIRLHECKSGSSDIKSLYEEASKTGKVSTKYIDYVLKPFKLNHETKKSIISLMETYDILCSIKSDANQQHCQYFVPYLLKSDVKPFDLTSYHVSDILYIGYEPNDIPYIPDGIYYCLLSSCCKEWNNANIQLYYQCAKFYLTDSHHYIIIKKDKSYIALQYCYQKLDNPTRAKDIISRVQTSIYTNCPHDIVKQKLSSLVDDRMPKFKGAKPRYYVRCIECSNLTSIHSNNKTERDNFIQCRNESCNMLSENQAVSDWINSNQEHEIGQQQATERESPTYADDINNHSFDVADMIGKDWTKLATALAMMNYIDNINAENDTIFDKARVLLTKWEQKFSEKATVKRLIQALQKVRRQDIVDKILSDKE